MNAEPVDTPGYEARAARDALLAEVAAHATHHGLSDAPLIVQLDAFWRAQRVAEPAPADARRSPDLEA